MISCKFLKVFLCTLIMFILPLSVFADLPSNDLEGSYSLQSLSISSAGTTCYTDDSFSQSYGACYLYSFAGLTSNFSSSMDFTIDVNVSDNFELYYFYSIPDYYITPLSIEFMYNNSAGSLVSDSWLSQNTTSLSIYGTSNVSSVTPSYDGQVISLAYSDFSSLTTTYELRCISNLPAGSYRIVFECGYTPPTSGVAQHLIGIIVDDLITGDPVTDYNNGLIDFDSANQQIMDNLQSNLSDPNLSDSSKQLAVSLADQQLSSLINSSNLKFDVVVDDFSENSTTLVNDLISSGTIDVLPSLDELGILYADSLSQSTTPDQGVLISSLYNVRLNEIRAIYDVNYQVHLDSIITDEDFSAQDQYSSDLDSFVSQQQDVLQAFTDSEYDSYLQFSSWFTDLSQDELNQWAAYTSLFNFLFSDDRSKILEPYLHIPFSLVITSILLGTTSLVVSFVGSSGNGKKGG